jgi:hypothetical protein
VVSVLPGFAAAAAVFAGAVYKYDLSMPTHKMYELVQLVRQRVAHLPGTCIDSYASSASQVVRCCPEGHALHRRHI